jgi:osmotically-inducible protein OsmY
VKHPCHRGLAVALALLSLSTLSGCIAAVAAGGVAGGYSLTQERGFEDTVRDDALKAAISHEFEVYNPEMAENLDLVVYEGRVLVTGRIPNPTWRDEAIKRVWATKGVKEVYNEIEIGPFSSSRADMDDAWISTQLRNDLVWDADIRSVNYIVTTSDHVVYVMGSARSQAELDRVTGYARVIPGVKRVVSYAQIRTGVPSAPASASSGPGATPPAGGGGTIEVQPLQ